MPVGPYSDFQTCIAAIMRKEKVDRESAAAICGKMEKQTNTKVEVMPAQGQDPERLYIKTFLIDASISGNAWGVSQQSIVDNIQSFIGKPLVLFKDSQGELDHPPSDAETIPGWAADQEPYRIGTIVDVVRKEQYQQGPHDDAYFAIIEVTDSNAKEVLQGTAQTLYVSPALADLHSNLMANRSGQVVGEESDAWVGMHLALVREPAYGIRKAQITARCGGDEQVCITRLRQARLAKQNCGFCVKTALLDSTTNPPIVAHKLDQLNTSQVTSKPKNKTLRLSEQDQSKEDNKTSETKKTTEIKEETNSTNSEIQKENARLKEQVEILKAKLAESGSLVEKVAKLENEIESTKMDAFLAKDNRVADEKLRRDKIRVYIGKGLKTSDVEEMWAGIPTAAAPLNQRKARLVDTAAEGRAVLGQNTPEEKEDERIAAMEAFQAIDGRFL